MQHLALAAHAGHCCFLGSIYSLSPNGAVVLRRSSPTMYGRIEYSSLEHGKYQPLAVHYHDSDRGQCHNVDRILLFPRRHKHAFTLPDRQPEKPIRGRYQHATPAVRIWPRIFYKQFLPTTAKSHISMSRLCFWTCATWMRPDDHIIRSNCDRTEVLCLSSDSCAGRRHDNVSYKLAVSIGRSTFQTFYIKLIFRQHYPECRL